MSGCFARRPWLIMAGLLLQGWVSVAENSEAAQIIEPASQAYALLQPFHVYGNGRRQAIYHPGMLTTAVADGFRISAVLDGYPAHQAGLRRGDLLIEVDGQPFHPRDSFKVPAGNTATAAVARTVQLQFQRNGERQTTTLEVVRENLYDTFRTATLNSAQQFSNGNKVIGYIRLWSLDRTAGGLQAYRQLLASLAHCDGLIVDVRDSYGFINAQHLDLFFPNRSRYFQVDGGHADLWQSRQPAPQADDYYDRAVVVMQNSGTRGGMELFAYQLAKLQRIVSVGQATAGKAGQVTVNEDGALLYLPAPALTVDGIRLEATGFAPEQPVVYPLNESAPNDPQFEAAMMTLMQIM